MDEDEKADAMKQLNRSVKERIKSVREKNRKVKPPRPSCCSLFKMEAGVAMIIFIDVL